MGQQLLPQFPIEGCVIDTNEHGLLDGPNTTVHFPAYSGKAVHIDRMSCGLAVSVMGEEALWCSTSLSPKVLSHSPIYSSSQHLRREHLTPSITLLFCVIMSLSLGPPKSVEGVVTS